MVHHSKIKQVHVVGGGLAGVEVAYQLLKRHIPVRLYEMRPRVMTEAHQSDRLAELVCSNSFKSLDPTTVSGELKREMGLLGSLVVQAALEARVPAGGALAVDRKQFSLLVEKRLQEFSHFERVSEEVTEIPSFEESKEELWVIASGPLTSKSLAQALAPYAKGGEQLYFYDAIAPVIDLESIDLTQGYWLNRWSETDADYWNIPLDQPQYERLVAEILAGEKVPLHEFEKTPYFEACLPIEVMAERGVETLRFGPLRPVGLKDPRTGKRPHAVIQLRQENHPCTMLSMVGFQTKLKWPEQVRIFRGLPGLEQAEFLRLGSVHRNTYFHSPKILNPDFSFKAHPHLFLAGQVAGVEGYLESAALGLLVGLAIGSRRGSPHSLPTKESVLGALGHYVSHGNLAGDYQPMNANLGLLPPLNQRGLKKSERKAKRCEEARDAFDHWFAGLGAQSGPSFQPELGRI